MVLTENIKGRKRERGGENGGREAKMSRGGTCGRTQAGERKPKGWLFVR